MGKRLKIFIAVLLAFIAIGAVWVVLKRSDSGRGGIADIIMPANYSEPMVIRAADFSFSIKPVGAKEADAKSGKQDTGILDTGYWKSGSETKFPGSSKLSFGYREIGKLGNWMLGRREKKIRYADTYTQADVVETIQGSGIKEEIILKAPGHPAEFQHVVNAADFLASKDEQGNLNFYRPERNADGGADELKRLFTIPAPFMIDAAGERSSTADVEMNLKDNLLTIKPSAAWLGSHKYPVILDPSVELAVLNVHSHPLQGENWGVSFTTLGIADLIISPNDQTTIDDDEFISLTCDGEARQPAIRAGDVIFYPDWSCAGTGKIVHKTLTAGDHTLKFQFGDEIAYAYNNFSGDRRWGWGENVGWLNASSTHEQMTVADAGLTGYLWGENIGWIKMDYDGIAGATNTTATDWGVTNDGWGNLGGYAWGENIGWLNFHPTHSQVKIDQKTADFSGYAWGENVGWLNFGHDLLSYVPRWLSAPTVFTLPASNIGSRVVTANGSVNNHGAALTERGFKYGLTETDTWSVSETGSFWGGDFKLSVPNLAPATTYYIRAYASSSEGLAYGSYVSFTTEAAQKGSPVILKENVILKEGVIMR